MVRLGRVPTDPYRSIVKSKVRPYTIYEEADSTGYDTASGFTNTGTSADLYLHSPQEAPSDIPTGEVREGSLQGVCLPDGNGNQPVADDRLVKHGGDVYELTLNPWPDSENPRLYRISGQERTDLST